MVIAFKLEKTTPGTFRYTEENDRDPKIGTLYVKKYAVPAGPPPERIEVELKFK